MPLHLRCSFLELLRQLAVLPLLLDSTCTVRAAGTRRSRSYSVTSSAVPQRPGQCNVHLAYEMMLF